MYIYINTGNEVKIKEEKTKAERNNKKRRKTKKGRERGNPKNRREDRERKFGLSLRTQFQGASFRL